MKSKRHADRSTSKRDLSGPKFLVLLLGFAFFHSLITEMNAWETIRKITDSMLHAIPGLAALESSEKHNDTIFETSGNRTESCDSVFLSVDQDAKHSASIKSTARSKQPFSDDNPHVPYLRGPPRVS